MTRFGRGSRGNGGRGFGCGGSSHGRFSGRSSGYQGSKNTKNEEMQFAPQAQGKLATVMYNTVKDILIAYIQERR